jgi:hypothetical protein
LVFFVVVQSMLSERQGDWFFAFDEGSDRVGVVLSTMAGMLLGVLGGVLLIRGRRSSDIECPRCGTFNARDAAACSACSLPLG